MGAGDNDEPTAPLPRDEVPSVAPLARIAAGLPARPPVPSVAPGSPFTTAADALRDEEVERTRLFIRMGWLLSVIAMGDVPVRRRAARDVDRVRRRPRRSG